MREKILANFHIALEAILVNKLRSILTALGIIFGVAAVIAMLAIGKGAQQEILEQIKLVGVNNIIITPLVEQSEEKLTEETTGTGEKRKFSPGLTLLDMQSIAAVVPGVDAISPEILFETFFIKDGIRRSAKLVGVEPDYFTLTNFTLREGQMFNTRQLEYGAPVCIIGHAVKARFFPQENPIGKKIKCGQHWLEVIGVLDERLISSKALADLGIRDYNMDVYTPIQTMLIRYKNRALVTGAGLEAGQTAMGTEGQEETAPTAPMNYHQLDRLVVRMEETANLQAAADVISRMLKRRHLEVVDFEITIPELLLKQQQRTKQIFNVVLGAIAGISLLVGGIGIMNIMLASVMERIKEIGLRLAIVAHKQDIILQFLLEAMLISISGGLLGIILGAGIATGISRLADIPTIISPLSVIVSFGVAAGVGLLFGIAPARKAASQNPINSLRYE